MGRILVLCGALLACTLACGCTDADRASLNAYGDQHHVELYSGGKKVREWYSTGKVSTEENSDAFYFKDSESKLLVRVTGNVVVTPIKELPSKVVDQYQEIPPEVDAGELMNGKPDLFESNNAL